MTRPQDRDWMAEVEAAEAAKKLKRAHLRVVPKK